MLMYNNIYMYIIIIIYKDFNDLNYYTRLVHILSCPHTSLFTYFVSQSLFQASHIGF